MTAFTVNAPPQKFTKTENSDSSVQIQIGPIFPFEFVTPDTRKSEFSVLLDVKGLQGGEDA